MLWRVLAHLASDFHLGAFAANATTAGTLETSAVIAAAADTLEGLAGGTDRSWSGGDKTFATTAARGQVRADQRRTRRPSSARASACYTLRSAALRRGAVRADLDDLVAGRRRGRAGGDAGDRAGGAVKSAKVRRAPSDAGYRRRARLTVAVGVSPSARCCHARNIEPARLPRHLTAVVGGAAARPARHRERRSRCSTVFTIWAMPSTCRSIGKSAST